MAYDRDLADRIRACLAQLPSVREVGMFGGMSFLVNGKIAVTADSTGGLMVRCDPDRVDELLGRDGAVPVQMGRRTMSRGWLRIENADRDLDRWIEEALTFNAKDADLPT